jgi:hypothetical protein
MLLQGSGSLQRTHKAEKRRFAGLWLQNIGQDDFHASASQRANLMGWQGIFCMVVG